MQILCLTVFWLFAICLPLAANAQANSAAEAMGLQVRQWMSQTHGVNTKEVVIAPLDDRLKVQSCQKPLNVDHPFASKETVRVRCAEPVWQLYLQVSMPIVACILFDHVNKYPTQTRRIPVLPSAFSKLINTADCESRIDQRT